MKIDHITRNSVSVVLEVTEEGEHRCAYANTQPQREELEALLPADLWKELLKIWGDEPAMQIPDNLIPQNTPL